MIPVICRKHLSKTGDSSNAVMWSVIVMMSVIGLFYMNRCRKLQ